MIVFSLSDMILLRKNRLVFQIRRTQTYFEILEWVIQWLLECQVFPFCLCIATHSSLPHPPTLSPTRIHTLCKMHTHIQTHTHTHSCPLTCFLTHAYTELMVGRNCTGFSLSNIDKPFTNSSRLAGNCHLLEHCTTMANTVTYHTRILS